MRPSIDRPVLDEPWAKRLRATRSRSVKAGQEQYHLPSPKPTNPSSTDNISSSSSSLDRKSNSKEKRTQSLRDRLVPLPKKPTPLPPIKGVTATKRPSAKPSVAPFFQRIEAAFQDKPTAASNPNLTASTARGPARSPSPDADDLIQQLKEHYLQTATTLHKQATMRLSQTHADLSRQLTRALTHADTAFLAETEAQIKTLAQPLDRFRIRSQQRGGPDGAVRSEEHSVAELVARAEEQLRGFEDEVAGLWREWAVAEGEMKVLLRGVVPSSSSLSSSSSSSSGGQVGGDVAAAGGNGEDDDEGEEMVRRFREVVEREIAEAEEEVVELGDEAVGVMKEIEKDFRKATLPDLHTFFQSIDEP